MPHEISDQSGILTDLPGALSIGNPSGLNDCRIVAHIVDHANESVVEDRQRLEQDVLKRRHGGPPRLMDVLPLLLDLGALFWRDGHRWLR